MSCAWACAARGTGAIVGWFWPLAAASQSPLQAMATTARWSYGLDEQGVSPRRLGTLPWLLPAAATSAAAGPVPYTEAMAAEDDELLADVTVAGCRP